MARERVVILRGEPIVDEQRYAAAPITPGMLMEIDGDGAWIPATAGGHKGKFFALERDEAGRGIDVAYEVDDYVKAAFPSAGDRINALIASGESVSAGDFMHPAAGGLLTTGAANASAIGVAAEDIDATEQTRLSVIIQ